MSEKREKFEFGKADLLRLEAELNRARECFNMADQIMAVVVDTIIDPTAVDRLLEAARLLTRVGKDAINLAAQQLPADLIDLPF